jgi:uncharacterized RDD family membrane protein YckC
VGFWLRALATSIDGVFSFILWIVAVVGLNEIAEPQLRLNNHSIGVIVDCVTIAVILFYTATDIIFRRTPGKFLVGIEIANADSSDPSVWTLANRWTYKWTFLFLWLLWIFLDQVLLQSLANLWMFLILAGCFAALGEAKLTWHDRWAKTAVFRRRELHPEKSPAGFPVLPARSELPNDELLADTAEGNRPSIWEVAGKAGSERSATDISAQVRVDRDSWESK